MKRGTRGLATVKWSTIQLPKEVGGLGVGDILMKKAILLNKWWWRFVNEEGPLCKRIVSSCNQIEPNWLMS